MPSGLKSMFGGRALIGTLLLIAILSGCANANAGNKAETSSNSKQTSSNNPKSSVTLTISAAASLKESMEEIAALYEAEHENIKLTMNFGASGSLQKQIEQGAPADLFLSAGQKQMTALIDGKFVNADSKVDLLRNRLVLIVPSDASVVPVSLEVLQEKDFGMIALGEPEVVPAGSYTKEALENGQLWTMLQPKMVFAKDVTQVLTYVESGNADAGFVYESDAKLTSKVKTALVLDEKSHTPILYPAGIVAATKYPDEADQFLEFLQSAAASDVFRNYGFSVAE
ncbi:molybdate ABC transporter substrate-binding protein [Paenibacillus vini]|uniref:Molybdate ABC transporter substrate-binding protein n=1 Tax=Paenibacillus vini TaxID=1476024 RepID=A0ABQ4MGM8_9BACL|nr:molybdate ABC transporter substrate-binding protein [Paenibacillus vini]GIP55131.1 molybdate ABC transporter substrate-binding protein [Paenibacillus vini]